MIRLKMVKLLVRLKKQSYISMENKNDVIMIRLTRAEEQMMHLLWKLGEGTVQDVMASVKEDKRPSRTTMSTIIRLLEEKGAVGHKPADGRGYIYYPILKKEEYSHHQLKEFIKRHFNNSFSSLACFFVRENNLSMKEIDELLEEIKKGTKK